VTTTFNLLMLIPIGMVLLAVGLATGALLILTTRADRAVDRMEREVLRATGMGYDEEPPRDLGRWS
jgi:hypothetical protein